MKPNCFDPCSWQLKYCLSRDAGNPRPRSACIQPQLAERTATVMVSRGTDSLITGLGILAIEIIPTAPRAHSCNRTIERRKK